MNNGLQGSTPKAQSTMSLSVRPQRRVISASVSRSQSFAGVNSTYEKTRHRTTFQTPTISRKSGSRVRRMFSMSHKSPPPKVPQPDRVDEVYNALKRGLGAYLEVHQMELDKLTKQIKESKRNSRLGFLYDLDKHVKCIERFIRKLEFHTSKIDELYEAYCIQRRLRDGAHNMVKAYTASPGSKEARESLSEAGKGYKEYTENMCVLENDLESQLGEFHIKMKGLAGFARLCAGDQYEIFMKYGRQRWKLRGRIEVNGKQLWDSEDMVFLPLITEFLSIKVTELKSLANHVVVGSVSCETKDLFAALPQVVAVDINDLGTVKLSLEVSWNPFDKEDQPSSASTVNKSSTVNKRFSTYNPSPPDTPSLREQAFYNMLRRQDDMENGAAWSVSSESSDDSSSPQLSSSARHAQKNIVQPEVQATPPDIEIAFSQTVEPLSVNIDNSQGENEEMVANTDKISGDKEISASGHAVYSRTLSHISEVSFDAAVLDSQLLDDTIITLPDDTAIIPQDADVSVPDSEESAVLPSTVESQTAQELDAASLTIKSPLDYQESTLALQTSNTEEPQPAVGQLVGVLLDVPSAHFSYLDTVLEEQENTTVDVITSNSVKLTPVDTSLEEAISSLNSSLDDYRGQFPELQDLERELKHLEDLLMQRQGVFRSRASSISLTVENALESFDFLNTTSDMEDSECSEDEEGHNERNLNCNCLPVETVSQSEDHVEDAGVCSASEGSSGALSTGNEHLDRALVIHLNNCCRLLLHLGTFGPLRCREMYALDKLMRESQILKVICRLTKEKSGTANNADEVIQFSMPKDGVLAFWSKCVQPQNVFLCSAESFLETLTSHYAEQVNALYLGMSEAVFVRLAELILDHKLAKRIRSTNTDQLTIFQYWSHFESLSVTALDSYVIDLAKEVQFVQNLNADDQNVVLKALKRVPENCVQREGFKALSLLLTNGNSKVIAAVTSLLRGFSENQKFRERALVCFLEQLEDEDVQTRAAGCAALGCVKAKESIDQLIFLCQTDKDEVKVAAKQSLMLFGIGRDYQQNLILIASLTISETSGQT
ncbi:rho family-interacting cell polarization regulator 1 isoform X2 [Xenopus laevis]|uniref:Rho family-interacting cell polarization regulator 1 isoform X2 n=1 Tax=Xenopus laevis TaxID=8355 RepID=A0A8J1MXI3_XENLA|nr:rho family-interacting cell polarization regulator 1 isoform X2 [Xenopus laevis]